MLQYKRTRRQIGQNIVQCVEIPPIGRGQRKHARKAVVRSSAGGQFRQSIR